MYLWRKYYNVNNCTICWLHQSDRELQLACVIHRGSNLQIRTSGNTDTCGFRWGLKASGGQENRAPLSSGGSSGPDCLQTTLHGLPQAQIANKGKNVTLAGTDLGKV